MVNKLTIPTVLEPFLTRPNQALHLADISREINAPHPSVRLWLRELEKKGVLRKSHKGRLTLFTLNKDHPNIIEYLTMAEKNKLIKICEKHLILRDFIQIIHKTVNEKSVALIFGSATKETKKANDIDLLVTANIDNKLIETFSKRFNKEVEVISVKKLSKVTETLRQEIIKKHLIISGSEQVLRWLLW